MCQISNERPTLRQTRALHGTGNPISSPFPSMPCPASGPLTRLAFQDRHSSLLSYSALDLTFHSASALALNVSDTHLEGGSLRDLRVLIWDFGLVLCCQVRAQGLDSACAPRSSKLNHERSALSTNDCALHKFLHAELSGAVHAARFKVFALCCFDSI